MSMACTQLKKTLFGGENGGAQTEPAIEITHTKVILNMQGAGVGGGTANY